ncbi:MAG TPA: S1 RNA-binding domain-containing protein [Gemmataceae bacterium]|nr:S1 RNA-binding domain-containing protein [Gemmataceae bacterium]
MSDTDKPPDKPSATEEPAQPPANTGPVPTLRPEAEFGAAPRLRDLDAEIEHDLQEALRGISEKDLFGEPAPRSKVPPAAEAGRTKARVLRVRGSDVFLDVPGSRGQGVLPAAQFPEGVPAVGTEVEVTIEGYDAANGLLLLSRQGAAVEADWSSVAEGMIVEARVTGTNKGGLSVDVNGIRGFMPISQIDLYRVENPEQYVNQRLLCLVTEVNRDERNLVVSRRALLEREREEARARLWNELAEGQVREGVVRSVKDFGAFVDLGGVDGLVHVSEMAWTRVSNPADVLQPGQKVKVTVLKVDRERHKVSLGMKQLQPSPWDQVKENYIPNTVVKGKVTRLMDFGAFVELEPGVEGLIHISELAPQRVRRVADVVQPGQEVQVLVLHVDPEQRRIALSLKGAQKAPAEEPDAEEQEEVEQKPSRPRPYELRGGLGDH